MKRGVLTGVGIPKETWALITWLVFAAYLHARITVVVGTSPCDLRRLAVVVWVCYLTSICSVRVILRLVLVTYSDADRLRDPAASLLSILGEITPSPLF